MSACPQHGDVQAGPAASEHAWLAGLALLGASVATYLALYQTRITPGVWDPLFGASSSEAVLRSPFSRSLPVPDAALGAVAYVVEAVLAMIATLDRQRGSPLLIVGFGAIIGVLAAAGAMLVLVQLVVVHALCTLCLVSAAISWINLGLGHTDVAASLRLVTHARVRRNTP
jgi:uncharacterized membrane protein